MLLLDQFILLAEYNQLMNQRQYHAVDQLSKDDLNKDTGAFFGSVLGTLNHIMVGDIVWLKRFAEGSSCNRPLAYFLGLEKPESLDAILFIEFEDLYAERKLIDELIINWVNGLSEVDVQGCIEYTNMAGQSFNKPLDSLINHLFMHQVHHRGQVSTLLSQFGVDFGETDLIEIIDDQK